MIGSGRRQGVPPVLRWRRRLRALEVEEVRFRRAGLWGLPPHRGRANTSARDAVLRVHLEGAFAKGGRLKAASSWPPGAQEGVDMGVTFECLSPGAALVEIEFAPYPAYQPFRPAVISFIKRCGALLNSGFDISTRPFQFNMGQTPDLVLNGASVGRLPAIGGPSLAANLYWRSQHFDLGAPNANIVSCPGDVAEAWLDPPELGEAKDEGGQLHGRQGMRFRCMRAGATHCTLRFAWQSLQQGPEIRFLKVCGGRRHDIDIASDIKHARVVLLQGKVDPSWGSHPQARLMEDVDRASFTLLQHTFQKLGEDQIKLAAPKLRVITPGIVKASVGGALAGGGAVETSTDGAKLEVSTECLAKGTTDIEVTLPFAEGAMYEPIRFVFSKACARSQLQQIQLHVAKLGAGGLVLCSFTLLASRMCGLSRRSGSDLIDSAGSSEKC